MSTTTESHYFPSLDKCLAGGKRLISWRAAHRALEEETAIVNNAHLEHFLNDDESITILSSALKPFGAPSPEGERNLETKTAPINVSQSNTGDYDLVQLKEDAKWLAKEIQVEELVALRIAIVELQERPADQLLTSVGEASHTLIRPNDLTASLLSKGASHDTGNVFLASSLDFSQPDTRRRRLVDVYFSETHHVLKICADLLGRNAVSRKYKTGPQHQLSRAETRRDWIDDLAEKVAQRIWPGEDEIGQETFSMECIKSIEGVLQRCEDRNLWPIPFRSDESCDSTYAKVQYVELISVLRLLLASIHAMNTIPGPSTIQTWFTIMDKHGFLQDSKPIFAAMDIAVPQHLVSIISLSILKLPLAVGELLKAAGVSGPKLPTKFYLSSEECAHLLNTTFYRCAVHRVDVAALAIYGWSIMTGFVREIAINHRAVREGLIESTNDDAEESTRQTRRGSRDWVSEFETLYDFLAARDLEDARDDPPRFFASVAVDVMRVFPLTANLSTAIDSIYGTRGDSSTALISQEALLDVVREGMSFVEYDGEILEAVLAILMPGGIGEASQQHNRVLAARFMEDDKHLRPSILDQALVRYPYELSPLLRLCKVLANAEHINRRSEGPLEIVQLLDNLQTMTHRVPEDFRAYQLDHEDENTNTMMLTDSLPIFTIKRNVVAWDSGRLAQRAIMSATNSASDESRVIAIPAGTSGVLVKETRPFVLKLDHVHSGLEYLGVLLSTFQANGELLSVSPATALDRFTAADLISVISTLLAATLKQRRGSSEAFFVLGRFGYALANEQDIISVIADLFEAELLAHLDQVAEDGSLELVTACAEFLVLLAEVSPERVWSILARNSLLGVNGSAVSLASVVGGIEAQLGRYRFLTACVHLYDKLLNDSIAGLVKRKATGSKVANRFDSPVESLDSIPERTIATVLAAFHKVLLDAFQHLPNWKFENLQERCDLVSVMVNAFTKLLQTTYGIDISKEPSVRLTSVLAPAAESLLEVCAPNVGPSPLVTTCAKILPDGISMARDSVQGQSRLMLIVQSKTLLKFLITLIRAAKFDYNATIKQGGSGVLLDAAARGTKSQRRARNLAVDMLVSMPTFAALLASDHSLKADLFILLSELVQSVNVDGMDPPAILSQLNAETAKSFLMVVTHLDRPLCDVHVERQAWNFLAAIMASKQQWFAIYLLTGTLSKDRAKTGTSPVSRPKSLLSYALDQLSNISVLPPERAAGMLRFVAQAQQSWVWATNELRSHPDFLANVLSWMENIEAPSQEPGPAVALISAKEYEMATYLCDILAINVHASLEIGDNVVLKMLVPKLKFLRDHGCIVNTYNRSLHRNLAENVKRKFPHSELSDFKRTAVNPASFGTEYFYDRTFAAAVLSHNLAWEGADRERSHGFSSEFSRANANLSLHDAQIGLLGSWRTLATTLCECANRDTSLQTELAQVAERCLTANANAQLDEPDVADLLKLRIELAFVLSSRLVSLKSAAPAMKDLLPACWELIRTTPVDYDVSSTSEDAQYYRSILQVLYLAIEPHRYLNIPAKPSRATDETVIHYLAPNTASCLVDIVGKVIMPGFRALCSNLHSNLQFALPADFALLTALLQAILSVPGISSVSTLVADLVAGSSVVRGALSLFSWADQLAEVTGQDPVYGEMAIMFLLALSTVRPVAEQMALEGILSQLSSANLSNYLRKPGGKGPFDEPQRMFAIWNEGFLPLCLNLLDAVGPPIASEVATFLNSFPEQLRRAERALQNASPSPRNPRAGAVTFGLVSEAHSLTMIAAILSADVARGAAEGIDAADVPSLVYDVDTVRDMVESLSRSKRSLVDRITAVGPLDAQWQQTPATGVSDNLLVAKTLKELSNMLECPGGSQES